MSISIFYNKKQPNPWVQIRLQMAKKEGNSPIRGNVALRQKGCRPTLVDCASANFLLILLRFTTKDFVQIPLIFSQNKKPKTNLGSF